MAAANSGFENMTSFVTVQPNAINAVKIIIKTTMIILILKY